MGFPITPALAFQAFGAIWTVGRTIHGLFTNDDRGDDVGRMSEFRVGPSTEGRDKGTIDGRGVAEGDLTDLSPIREHEESVDIKSFGASGPSVFTYTGDQGWLLAIGALGLSNGYTLIELYIGPDRVKSGR